MTLSFSYQYIARGLDSLVIIESGAYLVENVELQTWSLSLQTLKVRMVLYFFILRPIDDLFELNSSCVRCL